MTNNMKHEIKVYMTIVAGVILAFSYPAFAGSRTGSALHRRFFVASSSDFVGDSTTDNAKALQAAIDSANNAGGGVVELKDGKFLSGPITMKSNVTLRIDSSATLYAISSDTAFAGLDPFAFIGCDHDTNVTITGGGAIDGNGQPWWAAYEATGVSRPRLIEFWNTNHIVIDSVTLENSPMFNVSLENSWYDTLEYDTILAPSNSPNTDGIDPATCHVVYIAHCLINNGDDDIAVKSGRSDPTDPNAGCSQLWIKDCTFLHGHGVSIGSETSGGVDSMYVDSCSFSGTDNGIRIKSYRGNGGNVRHCVYSNLTMQNVANPIWISGYYPKIASESDPAQPVTATTPDFHDISIIHVVSTGSPTAGVMVGLPELPMKNMLLENDTISASTGLTIRNAAVDTVNTLSTATYGPGYILQVNGTFSRLTSVQQAPTLPSKYVLEQNSPNPFNPTTMISYSIPAMSHVTLRVYDILGRLVSTLVNGEQAPGEHVVRFDGTGLASGVYFYRLESNGFTQTKKLLLLK